MSLCRLNINPKYEQYAVFVDLRVPSCVLKSICVYMQRSNLKSIKSILYFTDAMSWVRDHSEILKQITHFAIYPATYFIYIGLLLPLFVIN